MCPAAARRGSASGATWSRADSSSGSGTSAAAGAGATDVTVILTHERGYRMRPFPEALARLAFPRFPRMARALSQRYRTYNAALDLLASPLPGVKVRVIQPQRLSVGRFTRS